MWEIQKAAKLKSKMMKGTRAEREKIWCGTYKKYTQTSVGRCQQDNIVSMRKPNSRFPQTERAVSSLQKNMKILKKSQFTTIDQ